VTSFPDEVAARKKNMILILRLARQALKITLFVFVMMLALEYVKVLSKGKIP
jgi:hypothetical protein